MKKNNSNENLYIDIKTPEHKKCLTIINECEDRGWTLKSNLLLLLWMSRCLLLLRSHYKKLKLTRRLFYTITISYVIISSLSSSLAFLNVGIAITDILNSSSLKPITVTIGSFSILSAMLAGILAFLNLEKLIQNEKYAITKLSKMVREIEIVIYSDIEERPLAKDFFLRINIKYYKYHNLGDVFEENIIDWKNRLEEAAKMNNSCFPSYEFEIQFKDNGRIKLSDNLIKILQKSQLKKIIKEKNNLKDDIKIEIESNEIDFQDDDVL